MPEPASRTRERRVAIVVVLCVALALGLAPLVRATSPSITVAAALDVDMGGAWAAQEALQPTPGVTFAMTVGRDPWGELWRARKIGHQAVIYSCGPDRKDERGGGDDVTVDWFYRQPTWREHLAYDVVGGLTARAHFVFPAIAALLAWWVWGAGRVGAARRSNLFEELLFSGWVASVPAVLLAWLVHGVVGPVADKIEPLARRTVPLAIAPRATVTIGAFLAITLGVFWLRSQIADDAPEGPVQPSD